MGFREIQWCTYVDQLMKSGGWMAELIPLEKHFLQNDGRWYESSACSICKSSFGYASHHVKLQSSNFEHTLVKLTSSLNDVHMFVNSLWKDIGFVAEKANFWGKRIIFNMVDTLFLFLGQLLVNNQVVSFISKALSRADSMCVIERFKVI